MRKEFHDLLPLDDARRTLADLAPEPRTETVALDDAPGRVLARGVDAPIDVPGFPRAAMDGYAVRSRDVEDADEADPARLAYLGHVPPGRTPDRAVEPGGAVEVSTGGVLPDNADAVVRVEDTDRRGDHVAVRRAVAPGDHVAPRGEDVARGERVLPAGRRLDARDVGTLAALGIARVPVRARPRVALLATGDEIRPVDADLGPGEIHDVNTHSLAAAVRDAGGEPRIQGRVPDDEQAMAEALDRAAQDADLIVTSGSTSASQVDILHRVVDRRGRTRVHGVDVKPGKPTFAATYADVGLVGLPGYPVSALTTFRLFVTPLVRSALGLDPDPPAKRTRAQIAHRVDTRAGRPWLLPVGLVHAPDRLLAYPVDRGSGATTSLADADGYVHVPAHTQRLDPGDPVQVHTFTRDVPADLVGMGEHCPALNRLLDRVPASTKWLRTGGQEAVRRAKLGVPDAVATPGEGPEDHRRVAAWRRTWGLASRGPTDPADLDTPRLARPAPGTHARDRAESWARDRGLAPDWAGSHRTDDALAHAVASGVADAAIVVRPAAEDVGLEFVAEGTEVYGVWVREDRTGKAGVEALVDAAQSEGFREVVEGMVGYEVGSASHDDRQR